MFSMILLLFEFGEDCFMTHCVVDYRVCAVCRWEECVLSSFGWRLIWMSDRSIWSSVKYRTKISVRFQPQWSHSVNGVAKFPTLTVCLSKSLHRSVGTSFMNTHDSVFSAYIVNSSCWGEPFTIIKYLSLPLLIIAVLKSIFYEIRIAICPSSFFLFAW